MSTHVEPDPGPGLSTDNARQVASMRSDRAAHAHAVAHGDLGAVILTGDDTALVCRALLDVLRQLEAQLVTDRVMGRVSSDPAWKPRILVDVEAAYEAVKSASARMP